MLRGRKIRGVLLDLSGVLYIDNQPVPGAIEALGRLRDAGLSVRFLTNTTRTPQSRILDKLESMGFTIKPGEIFTAPLAAKKYIQSENLSPFLLVHRDLMPEFTDIPAGGKESVLVGDAADDFTYANLNHAFRLLQAGAILLAMGTNRYFRTGDTFSMDAGPFVRALEYAAGCKALILGKPAAEFYNHAIETMQCTPEETVMVGDDAEADVLGAQLCNINGILVRTGKYRSEDEALISGKAVSVDDVGSAVDVILNPA